MPFNLNQRGRRRMPRIDFRIAPITICLLAIIVCAGVVFYLLTVPPMAITLHIGTPIAQARSLQDWPKHAATGIRQEELYSRYAIQQLHNLTIVFPDTACFSIQSYQTILVQERGILQILKIQPMQTPLPFQQAVSVAHRHVKPLLPSNSQIDKRIGAWLEQNPVFAVSARDVVITLA